MSALMLARFNVGDADALATYLSEVKKVAAPFGAEPGTTTLRIQ